MALDLTKPMRVKKDAEDIECSLLGKQVWPTNKPSGFSDELCVIVEGYDKWCVILKRHLENIPEIIRIDRWVNVYLDIGAFHGTRESADEAAQSTRLGNPVHLIFCHDPETGKTWAEVPEEGE